MDVNEDDAECSSRTVTLEVNENEGSRTKPTKERVGGQRQFEVPWTDSFTTKLIKYFPGCVLNYAHYRI